MHSKLLRVIAGAGMLLAAGLPVAAHHSFSAEFDQNKQLTLEGKVVQMEWVNPHSWIHVEITKPDGSKEVWMVEGGSPNALFRRGVTKDALPQGTEISVDGYQAKDGSNRANGRDITFADGRKLFVGGSNPDEQPNAK